MIETNHQLTCDQCDEDCETQEPVHSLQEFGEVSVNKFRRLMAERGWKRTIDGKDWCPRCVQKWNESRKKEH